MGKGVSAYISVTGGLIPLNHLIPPHPRSAELLSAISLDSLLELESGSLDPLLADQLFNLKRFAGSGPPLPPEKAAYLLAEAFTVELRRRGLNQRQVSSLVHPWLKALRGRGVTEATLTKWVRAADLEWDYLTEGNPANAPSGSPSALLARTRSTGRDLPSFRKTHQAEIEEAKRIEDEAAQRSIESTSEERRGRLIRPPGGPNLEEPLEFIFSDALSQARRELVDEFNFRNEGGLFSARDFRLPESAAYMKPAMVGEQGFFHPWILTVAIPHLFTKYRIEHGANPTGLNAQALVGQAIEEYIARNKPGQPPYTLAKEVRLNSTTDFRWMVGEECVCFVECKAYGKDRSGIPLVTTTAGKPLSEALESLHDSLSQMDTMLNIRQLPADDIDGEPAPEGAITETVFELLDSMVIDSIRNQAPDLSAWKSQDGAMVLSVVVERGHFKGQTVDVSYSGGAFRLADPYNFSHRLLSHKGISAEYALMETYQRAGELYEPESAPAASALAAAVA